MPLTAMTKVGEVTADISHGLPIHLFFMMEEALLLDGMSEGLRSGGVLAEVFP
jgi:hypothetical protein